MMPPRTLRRQSFRTLESFIAMNILDDRPRIAEQFALLDEVRDCGLWREGGHESFGAWLDTLEASDDVEAYRKARGVQP